MIYESGFYLKPNENVILSFMKSCEQTEEIGCLKRRTINFFIFATQ